MVEPEEVRAGAPRQPAGTAALHNCIMDYNVYNASLLHPYRQDPGGGSVASLEELDHFQAEGLTNLTRHKFANNDHWNKDYLVLWAQLVCILGVAMVTLTGNVMVIVTLIGTRGHKKATNCLIISLAFADLLIGFLLPLSMTAYILQKWPFQELGCKIFRTTSHASLDASMLSTLLVTLDRWWAIQKPFQYRVSQSRKKAVAAILAAWTVSFVVYIPAFAASGAWPRAEPLADAHACLSPFRNSVAFAFSIGLVELVVPLIVVLSCNLSIYRKIRGRKDSKVRRSVSTSDYFSATSSSNNLSTEDLEQRVSMLGKRSPRHNSLVQTNGTDEHAQDFLPKRRRSMGAQRYLVNGKLGIGEAPCHRASCDADPVGLAEQRRKLFATRGRRVSFDMFLLVEQATQGHRQSLGLNPSVRRNSTVLVKEMLTRQNQKAARALALLVSVLLLCWCPYVLLRIVTPFTRATPLIVHSATEWLCYLNSTLNPFLHIFGNKGFTRRLRYVMGLTSQGYHEGFTERRPSIFSQAILPGTSLATHYRTVTRQGSENEARSAENQTGNEAR